MKKQKDTRKVKKSTKFANVADRDLVAVVGGNLLQGGLVGKLLSFNDRG
jgi:hypothetical protein